MTDIRIGEFISNIVKTLEKNGYPEKKVALPLDKMYELGHEKGVSFNKVLEFLEEKGITHTKTIEKIVFEKKQESQLSDSIPSGFDMSSLASAGMGGVMKMAAEMMKNMSPEKLAEIQNQLKNISPEQMQQMKGMYENMSPEEKSKVMDTVKNLGKS